MERLKLISIACLSLLFLIACERTADTYNESGDSIPYNVRMDDSTTITVLFNDSDQLENFKELWKEWKDTTSKLDSLLQQ